MKYKLMKKLNALALACMRCVNKGLWHVHNKLSEFSVKHQSSPYYKRFDDEWLANHEAYSEYYGHCLSDLEREQWVFGSYLREMRWLIAIRLTNFSL